MYKETDDYEILYMINENEDCYEVMLEKYKPLIITICNQKLRKVKDMGYELEDLVQVANIALIDAIKNYNDKDNQNTKFYTYLSHCIHNKLNTEIRDNDTNKKKALNTSISYYTSYNNTILLDVLEDKNAIDPYMYLDIQELKNKYIKILNSLPLEASVVLELKISGLNQKEIETIMNISTNTFTKCLSLIKRKLSVNQ